RSCLPIDGDGAVILTCEFGREGLVVQRSAELDLQCRIPQVDHGKVNLGQRVDHVHLHDVGGFVVDQGLQSDLAKLIGQTLIGLGPVEQKRAATALLSSDGIEKQVGICAQPEPHIVYFVLQQCV